MSSKTLIIQVSRRRAVGGVALSSIGSLRITGIFERPVSDDGADSGLVAGGPWDRIVAGLPAQAVAYRILELPFHDRRRIGQAVGPALEEHVPLSLDDGPLAWDHTGPARSGRVLAGLAGAEAISAVVRDLAAVAGTARRLIWTPTAIVAAYRRSVGVDAEFVAVDVSDEGAVVAVVSAAGLGGLRVLAPCADDLLVRNVVWSLRTLAGAEARVVLGGHLAPRLRPAIERALPNLPLEALPQGSPVEGMEGRDWRDRTALVGLVLAAAGEAAAPLLDFTPAGAGLLGLSGFAGLAGISGLSELGEEFKPALRWGVAALLLGCVSIGIDYAQLLARRTVLSERADQLYADAMPDHSGGTGRRLKMEMRLRELTGRAETAGGAVAGTTSLHLLASLSQAVPKNVEVELDQLEHAPPSVKVTGRAGSFESVTKLQEALRRDEAFATVEVKDVHAAVSGGGVEFVLALTTAGRTP
ncbi:MAG: PilN domain-containing protein [Deltaproteobacteria bacterium]|nr:PilN domain-containing protein [Deltaproteobacteria bacterium]